MEKECVLYVRVTNMEAALDKVENRFKEKISCIEELIFLMVAHRSQW